MSDKTIRVGDLVMVVRPHPCCGWTGRIGEIHTVTGFYPSSTCSNCKQDSYLPVALIDGKYLARDICTLKRIDPPALPESVTTDEVIHA